MLLAGKRPDNLGVRNNKLAPCPNTPNCVCSQEKRRSHAVEPLSVSAPPGLAMEKVKTAVASIQGATIITSDANYLHAECKSQLLGFIDDLEVLWDEENQLCHVRSASRLGYSDLGANRKRVENLRKLLASS